jgi:large subunit ribosomal protein L25
LELIKLNATTRTTTGKGAARKLRQKKAIPAIIYRAKSESVMLTLDESEFAKIIRLNGTSGLFFDLEIDGDSAKRKMAMLKAIQMDTFGDNFLHIDLHEIDMDHRVTVSVPVETVGESAGVKEGGLLQIIRRDLDVFCKPGDTPDSVKIDVTELAIGEAVHVEDIDLGSDIEIPHDVNFTVITISAPSVEEEEVDDDDDDVVEAEAAPDADAAAAE